MQTKDYLKFIDEVKQSILQSRYRAASLANRELVLLYYITGYRLATKIQEANWGDKVIRNISKDLQTELPGLRGFSYRNLMKMRQFADAYSDSEIVPLITAQFESSSKILAKSISRLLTNQFQTTNNEYNKEIFSFLENVFLKVGFTHHITILDKCKTSEERLFYMQKCVQNQWTVSLLEHHIESDLYRQKWQMINNFEGTLPEKLSKFATNAFKGELLIDFININEDEDDERVFENEIVRNIKKFIMSLGNDFAFMGNQYRLVIEDVEEVFVDLLFFHRKLQCLVAFELKRGKFKAEYAGKMNLYLSALDEYVKQPHENPSIGIILCKKKNDKYVEFSFRDVNKPMGVATYKTSREVPEKYKNLLPKPDDLIQLL